MNASPENTTVALLRKTQGRRSCSAPDRSGKRLLRQVAGFMFAIVASPLAQSAVAPMPPTLCVEDTATCTSPEPTTGTAIKFHPGHYVAIQTYSREFDTQAERFAFYDTLAKEPAITGVMLQTQGWAEFEGAKDDYTPAFKLLDAEIAKLSSYGKRLILNIGLSVFADSTTRPSVWPAYLNSPEYGGGPVRFKDGWMARMWETSTSNRWIALHQALGARYDSNPYFEMVINGEETAVGWSSAYPAPATFSEDAYVTQIIRQLTALRAAWPTTMIMANTNWIRGMTRLYAALPDIKAGAGGPDVLPYPYRYPGQKKTPETSQSDNVYTGTEGGIDYRGVIPFMNQVQSTEFYGKEGHYLPKEIYNQKMLHRQSHFGWIKMWALTDAFQSTYDRTDMSWTDYKSAVKWETGILPFLRANPATHTTPPSSLGRVKLD